MSLSYGDVCRAIIDQLEESPELAAQIKGWTGEDGLINVDLAEVSIDATLMDLARFWSGVYGRLLAKVHPLTDIRSASKSEPTCG